MGILSRKYDLPIYANLETWKAMSSKIGAIETKNKIVFENDKSYSLGDIIIRPFSIPHDSADAVGYNIYSKCGKKISIATDIGNITENIRKHLYKSELVVLESNYDESMLLMGPYPYNLKKRVKSDVGHLSNEHASEFCVELVKNGTKTILLAHLSKENNFPELAFLTAKATLTLEEICLENDVKLEVLERDNPSGIYMIGEEMRLIN